MKTLEKTPVTPPFKVTHTNDALPTPEELEAKAKEMLLQAENARAEAEKTRAAKLEQDRAFDLETLGNLKREVKKLEFVEKGTVDPEKRADLYTKIASYQANIAEIEEKYGLNVPAALPHSSPDIPNDTGSVMPSAVLITTLKIAALIAACWGIVLYSGDWIIAKYPNAAIYNEVSFQKVLFGFSVFIGGLVSAIIAFNVFFPGFGKYFNPFNHSSLDFYDDFQTLTPWQRNLIAIALFFCLLCSFVLIAGGKLD